MTTNIETTPDLRPLLSRALDQTGKLIAGTDPADATRATPCAEFDVAALIGHLHGVIDRIAIVVSGGSFQDQPGSRFDRAADPSDWSSTWDDRRPAVDTALQDADLTRVVAVPWGQVPVIAVVGSYIGELATHGWDLAAATGRIADLDPELAEAALPMAMAKIPAEIRDNPMIPFGPVVAVPADAPAYDRLVAWNGRNPADWC